MTMVNMDYEYITDTLDKAIKALDTLEMKGSYNMLTCINLINALSSVYNEIKEGKVNGMNIEATLDDEEAGGDTDGGDSTEHLHN